MPKNGMHYPTRVIEDKEFLDFASSAKFNARMSFSDFYRGELSIEEIVKVISRALRDSFYFLPFSYSTNKRDLNDVDYLHVCIACMIDSWKEQKIVYNIDRSFYGKIMSSAINITLDEDIGMNVPHETFYIDNSMNNHKIPGAFVSVKCADRRTVLHICTVDKQGGLKTIINFPLTHDIDVLLKSWLDTPAKAAEADTVRVIMATLQYIVLNEEVQKNKPTKYEKKNYGNVTYVAHYITKDSPIVNDVIKRVIHTDELDQNQNNQNPTATSTGTGTGQPTYGALGNHTPKAGHYRQAHERRIYNSKTGTYRIIQVKGSKINGGPSTIITTMKK